MSVGAVLARDTPGYSTSTMDIRQSSKSTGCTRTARLVSSLVRALANLVALTNE